MKVRIGIIGYGELTNKINKIIPCISDDIEIIVKDGTFSTALSNALKLESDNSVDVIVSAGSNSEYIKSHIKLPYVDIKITGFDLLFAFKKAKEFSNDIAVVTYKKGIKYLNEVQGLLNINIIERTYENKEDLVNVIEELKRCGVYDLVGSSLVCELGRSMGLRCYFIYSEDGIMSSIEHAIDIAKTRLLELEKAKELHAMLEYTYEGIIVVDCNNIIKIFNKSAEKLLGIKSKYAIGKNANDIIENSRLNKIISENLQELNQIQIIGNKRILTNRVAITLNNKVIGALATFQSVDQVRKAEDTVRRSMLDKGFIAKNSFSDIIGNSRRNINNKKKAKLFAKSDATILIEGETGTGKELFAQSIHNESNRHSKPFVAINCAALPPSLLESELFGYEEGAFSGAKKGGKYGVFELANEGTVFLDEIGEISFEVQTRLLRVLEEKEIFRIGDNKVTKVDIRIIAATNKDLLGLVKLNKFREDLYYRLNVLNLKIYPLREKKEDLPLLFAYFIKQYNKQISNEEISLMLKEGNYIKYDWPGNIRELRNIAERIAVLYNSYDDMSCLNNSIDLFQDLKTVNIEKELLINTLMQQKGNKTKTAEKLGIGRTTLWRKIKEYNISADEYI